MLEIQKQSFLAYPEKHRPVVDEEEFLKRIDSWNDCFVYGAFHRESGKICGYSLINEQDRCIHFSVQKTIPEYEKYGINAALVFKILEDCDDKLRQGMYICDGARSINHETNFQNYLEKYFGFRKAYCKLHLVYKGKMKLLIKLLYPFRGLLKKLDGVKLVHKINAVIRMEEAVRLDRHRGKNG